MNSALVSAHGLKNKICSCAACFGSWNKERGIFMAPRLFVLGSALVSAHGLKNEVY